MNLALVTSGYPPEVGGVELYVHHLARELGRMGNDVDVLTQCAPGSARKLSAADEVLPGVRVLRFDDWTHTRQFRVAPGLVRHLAAHRHSYDVIHAHNFHALPALAAAVSTRCPLVFTPYYHGGGHTAASRALHVPYGIVARMIFARASAVLCISEAERRRVIEDFPAVADRSSVVGIGVDVGAIRAAEPYALKRPIVLVVGRRESYKQVDLAIEAFCSVELPSELVIIGSGPERERIAAQISARGLDDRVRMLGYLEDAETRRWQRTATVALSLSRAESFGLGLAEAVVAGARVVASDIPAHREVSEMSGGGFSFVHPDTDPGQIASALTAALEPGIGEAGTWTIPSWAAVAQRTVSYYESAMSAPRPFR